MGETTITSLVGDTASEPLYLVVCPPGRASFSVPLPPRGIVALGRVPPIEVLLDHPSVSRRHATLGLGDAIVLSDLGSRNGTRVGGRSIADGVPESISPGDLIQIGDVICFVQPRSHAEKIVAGALGPSRSATQPRARGLVVGERLIEVYALLELVAPTQLPVLVLGETGVGKDVFARSVHEASPRASKPFTQLNCAALPEALLEAELFGFERGAFTGAASAKPGLFEATSGGTVFLDELGDMALGTQAKLLVALEAGQATRLGGLKPVRFDVRIVAATNLDLAARVKSGDFRTDLYFRLNGMSVVIPPLRDRKDEIEPLARHFLHAIHPEPSPTQLSPAAIEKLRGYAFPGNVRELKTIIERACVLSRGGPIEPAHIVLSGLALLDGIATSATAPRASGAPLRTGDGSLRAHLDDSEREKILDVLQSCAFNQSRAAATLGISRATLMRRMIDFGIQRPRK